MTVLTYVVDHYFELSALLTMVTTNVLLVLVVRNLLKGDK